MQLPHASRITETIKGAFVLCPSAGRGHTSVTLGTSTASLAAAVALNAGAFLQSISAGRNKSTGVSNMHIPGGPQAAGAEADPAGRVMDSQVTLHLCRGAYQNAPHSWVRALDILPNARLLRPVSSQYCHHLFNLPTFAEWMLKRPLGPSTPANRIIPFAY